MQSADQINEPQCYPYQPFFSAENQQQAYLLNVKMMTTIRRRHGFRLFTQSDFNNLLKLRLFLKIGNHPYTVIGHLVGENS